MTRSWFAIGASAPLVLASLISCSKPEADTHAPPAAPQATQAAPAATPAPAAGGGDFGDGPGAAQAEVIFKTRCSTCHGMEGKGNGPASLTLNPKPRNYTDVAWQKSVTDEHILEIIVKGGAAVGKSALMPPNPDLADKPDVVSALMHKVRSFGKGAAADGGK